MRWEGIRTVVLSYGLNDHVVRHVAQDAGVKFSGDTPRVVPQTIALGIILTEGIQGAYVDDPVRKGPAGDAVAVIGDDGAVGVAVGRAVAGEGGVAAVEEGVGGGWEAGVFGVVPVGLACDQSISTSTHFFSFAGISRFASYLPSTHTPQSTPSPSETPSPDANATRSANCAPPATA